MATNLSTSVIDGTLLTEVEWNSSSPVTFHTNKGKNIRLTEGNKVATRVTSYGCAIVFTAEPLRVGQLFQVTVTKRSNEIWAGGLKLGLTEENPAISTITETSVLDWREQDRDMVCTLGREIYYNDTKLCKLGFNTMDLQAGESPGLLLTSEGECHWFLDGEWRGSVPVRDFPLDQPMWGVVDVYALCEQVRADICTVSKYPPESEGRLVEMGLIQKQTLETKGSLLQEMLGLSSDSTLQLTPVREQSDPSQSHCQQLQQEEVELWQVSPDEVSVREDQILGRGAWGYVAKGTFRGTEVAVKRVYPEILQQTTVERIHCVIRTMAQIRHPNLVLFIAVVLNEQTGPMIVTELLDISLREAYQTNRVGPNKRMIFEDVASALLYLHRQREPIIHRDVSSANVLLSALPNHTWLAKVSDFGSANLVRDATTPGEGAILYTAPEAFPQGLYSPQPRPRQTTKIDVYSFGVLACEVATQTFPKAEVFRELLSRVSRVWGELHPLIVSCVSHSPQERPSMDIVLQQLKRMDSEP